MNSQTPLVRCPCCRAIVWEDLHALKNGIATRFRCIRCGRTIYPGGCSRCGKKGWTRIPDMFEKESRKPVVRFRCPGCGRLIGILLD